MNAHTPFDANQDWTNPYCQNSSNDPMVDALLGNAYHVVRTVYCNLGNLKLLYDFLNQYGMVIGVNSEEELKALSTQVKYSRIYGFSRAGDRQVTDYLYVEGDRTGILPNDTTATGSWITVATSGSAGGGISSGEGAYIPWVYSNGSAAGGETTINVPDGTVGVPFIIVNGDMQYVGRGFEFNIDSLSVTLAQPLEEGDEVVFLLTGVPAVPDNPHVNDWVQINWLYNNGAAVGGEQVIAVPYTFQSVPAVYKNGLRLYKGLTTESYTADPDNQRILLTEPLSTNDRLIVQIGGEAHVLEASDHTIQEVARAANVKDSEVILSTDTTQVLNGKKIIYDVVAQRIYGLPTLPTNVYINSVSNGQLTYSPGNITVALLDSYQQYIGDGSQLSVLAAGSDTPRTLADRFADEVNIKDFGAVGDGITDDTLSIQAAINAANPFGKKIRVPAGRYKCRPLIAKQGFKLFGAGNRYSSATIDTNISLFLCDLADGEAFISYVGDGKWPEGEVEMDNLAFENLNSHGGTAGVVAANNRVFWAVADSADVYPARWIQKKEGGDNCPKSVFTRCTFSKFFIGIDIHSWMSRFEDLTSYSCGVLLRAYGTSNIVNRVWAVDPLWAGIQMKSTYSEVNACSFGEQPTNNAAAKGFELHGGYVVINGCGAEATIEDFIWAYNGSLIVNNSRPSTALPTKNFITIDAYATAMINGSYTPGSFSNSFSRAKDIFALDGITISPAPRCTDTNKLPFTESAFNPSSGYYEGLCGTASKEASAIVLKTNNQNTNPKWSGETTLRSLPLLWEYSGTVRGSSILKSDVNFSVNGNFLNTDGGYQFDCRISKISNKGVILTSKLQDSGVLVSVYKKAGVWTHDYVYYGAAAGLTNDKGEQLIKAVFFQGNPLSTIRITIRDEVMTGKTEDELTNSQVELIINASGDVPLLTGQNEAFTYFMRTTP